MNPASVGHQCPECVAEGRKTQRPVQTVFGGSREGARGMVTISLIVLNVAVMLLSALSAKRPGGSLGGGSMGGLLGGTTPLSAKLAVVGESGCQFDPIHACYSGIADGQYYRLITAMFVHYGLLHIAFNMYALWILGRPLEALFGRLRFLGIYLVCGIGGNVAVYLFAPGVESAGASTAIFGLFAVFYFALRKLGRDASTILPILVINIVITFLVPNISIAGHLGGLAVGAVVGYGMTHAPREHRTLVQVGVLVGTLVVLVVLTLYQTHQLTTTLLPAG
jgi:membrane associated rhomboid family serine protease